MTLWQWSVRRDAWEWITVCDGDAEQRRKVLRGHKRRSATGAKFKWTPGPEPPTRKYRPRAVKMKELL